MPFLEIDDLRKSFGGLAAVDGVTLTLEKGELRALVGPNGCGKSTLFNLITGALPPDAGRVRFAGEDVTGLPPFRIAQRGIGRKFQVPAVFDELTVAQNLAVPGWAAAGGRLPVFAEAAAHIETDLLRRIGLADRAARLASELAHGERQWLEIGMLLASRARLLLLDEPTAGMTPAETVATARLVREVAAGGAVTVLVIEHDMAFVRELGCPVTVMAKGRLLRSGSFEEVRADPRVRELYFGRAAP